MPGPNEPAELGRGTCRGFAHRDPYADVALKTCSAQVSPVSLLEDTCELASEYQS